MQVFACNTSQYRLPLETRCSVPAHHPIYVCEAGGSSLLIVISTLYRGRNVPHTSAAMKHCHSHPLYYLWSPSDMMKSNMSYTSTSRVEQCRYAEQNPHGVTQAVTRPSLGGIYHKEECMFQRFSSQCSLSIAVFASETTLCDPPSAPTSAYITECYKKEKPQLHPNVCLI